jgi:uncharacterized protein (TIGR02001 family)
MRCARRGGAVHPGISTNAFPEKATIMKTTLAMATLVAGSFAAPTHAQDALAAGAKPPLTAHVDLASRYVLRGVTTTYGNGAPLGNPGGDAPESDKPALQWGVDYVHESGFYAGYWASQINYSYAQLGRSWVDRSITDFQRNKSIENDIYAGYNGSFGALGYTAGLTYYHYFHGQGSNAFETKLGLTYGPVTLTAQTLLDDVVWGNRGDTYWSAVYSRALAWNLSFTANLGFYTYHRQGRYFGSTDTLSGAACGAGAAFVVNGCYAGGAPVGSGFRHLILGLSRPIGDTGLSWAVQAIVAGKNRFGVAQGDRLVASLSYGF